MNPAPTPRDPPSSTITAILVVLVLAGLIAMAAGGDPMWAPPRVGWVSRWAILLGLTTLWIPGLVVAGAVVLIAHRNLPSRKSGTAGLRKTALRAVAPATVILTITSLLAITSTELDRGPPENEGVAPAPPPPGRPALPFDLIGWFKTSVVANPQDMEPEASGGETPGSPDLPGWLILAGMLATVAALAVWRHHGKQEHPDASDQSEPHDPKRRAFHGTVLGTIDAMLADPDPHTAIVGAYARLLEGLAACGVGRRDHEGPMEHLHRVLTVLDVRPDPSQRLVGLFGVARFSTHLLDSSHREEALNALREVAEDLAAAPRSGTRRDRAPALESRT